MKINDFDDFSKINYLQIRLSQRTSGERDKAVCARGQDPGTPVRFSADQEKNDYEIVGLFTD